MIIKAKRLYTLIISVFILASSLLISADNKVSLNDKIELPIIMYHHISKKASALGDYVITPNQFESDLKFIKQKGYETITSQNLVDYFDGKFDLPEKPIMITEYSCSSMGGDKVAWIEDMFKSLENYDKIKLGIWWHAADYDGENIARPYFMDTPDGTLDVFKKHLK